MTGCIVGWAHSPFGRLDGETVESLVVKAANGALKDAGIEVTDTGDGPQWTLLDGYTK